MLNTYKKALPCRLGSIVGRIVGESDKGSWGEINGIPMYSVPQFATPHGTVINVGVINLFPLTHPEEVKLREFEAQAQIQDKAYYGNYLTKEDTKW